MEKRMRLRQFNQKTNKWESKELHHAPSQREGGLFDFIEVWPEEHELLDPHRNTGQ